MNLNKQATTLGPDTSPMNLTCTSKPPAGAANAGTTYTIELQSNPSQPLTPPAGSTTVVAADPTATYTFSGTLPSGHQIDIQVNGAGVLIYSTP